MLEKFMILFISAAALVIVCWILAEYWLRSVRKLSVEKISNLSIWNRDEEISHYRQAETCRKEDCREKDIFKKERKYKMKANM